MYLIPRFSGYSEKTVIQNNKQVSSGYCRYPTLPYLIQVLASGFSFVPQLSTAILYGVTKQDCSWNSKTQFVFMYAAFLVYIYAMCRTGKISGCVFKDKIIYKVPRLTRIFFFLLFFIHEYKTFVHPVACSHLVSKKHDLGTIPRCTCSLRINTICMHPCLLPNGPTLHFR